MIELIQNPGFNIAGGYPDMWANWVEVPGDGAIAAATDWYYPTTPSAKLTAGATANTYLYQDFVTIPGTLYNFMFVTRGDGGHDGRYGVYDNSNLADIVATTSTGVTGSANPVSGTFTAPAGCTSASICLRCPSTNAGWAEFDDVSVNYTGTPTINNAIMFGCNM